jgi:hypothetical protein
VDGPANVREKPNGRIILTLDDSGSVECSGVRNNWFYLRLLIMLHKSEFTGKKDVVIAKDISLINESGVKIGRTVDSVKGHIIREYSSGKFLARVDGVTYNDNIRGNSVIEDEIEKIVNDPLSELEFAKFEVHLKKFEYDEWFDYQQFRSYIIHDCPIDASPGPRVILFFYQNKLYAILYNREIESNKFVSRTKISDYNVAYVKDLGEKIRKEFEEHYFKIILTAG